jgi:hypothetical protein
VIKLYAAVAVACVVAASGGATAHAQAADLQATAAKAATSAAKAATSAAKAEAAARAALAPLPVERALCVRQSPRRTLCLLAHPQASGLECRSAVLVRPGRVRVVQSYACFELREVTP